MFYSSAASVIIQSECLRQSNPTHGPSIFVDTAYTGTRGKRNDGRGRGKRGRKKLTAVELSNAKLKEPCPNYGKVGHWVIHTIQMER